MSFKSERQMSNVLRKYLISQKTLINFEIIEQFGGILGIPDYLLIKRKNGNIEFVIAVELKLKNWKRALKQAFRYRIFTNKSIVVFDEAHIKSIKRNINLFEKYQIGLASFSIKREFKLYYNPCISSPFSPYYFSAIERTIRKKELNILKAKDNHLFSKPQNFTQQNLPLAQMVS